MACLPATQFGCGFTVTCGVKFILLLNLAANVITIAMSVGNLIFHVDGLSSTAGNYGAQALMLMFSLAGVPIIVMAFNGVRYRNEAQVRMYLYYMWIIIAVSVVFILKEFVFSGACTNLPQVFAQAGQAWACGIARYLHIAITAVSLSILAYFQHVVYSHCEDLGECGGGPELGDLVLNKEAYAKNYSANDAYSSLTGMAGLADSGSLWEQSIMGGSIYGASSGLGGGQQIFGGYAGGYHEMAYPPHGGSVQSAA